MFESFIYKIFLIFRSFIGILMFVVFIYKVTGRFFGGCFFFFRGGGRGLVGVFVDFNFEFISRGCFLEI